MADFTSSPNEGAYFTESDADYSTAQQSNTLARLTNVAGAVVSLVLIVGIAVWGYKLFVRDVSGIPVVRAVAGDMRVRPAEPGGQLARHQGLSVNVIAAEGAAGRPADELRLAPRPVDLTEEDGVTQVAMVADAPQPVVTAAPEEKAMPDVAAALNEGNVDDLVAQLTDGIEPLSEVDDATEGAAHDIQDDVNLAIAALEDESAPDEEVQLVALDAPGVKRSLRPHRRPADLAVVVKASLSADAAPANTAPAAPGTRELDAATLPEGTRLAQLGAFDSPEVARDQWDKLQGRFGAYLQDKQRVVQRATSGGKIFYRLRAHGFEDIADARSFCSALVAENADCIPVVTR